jgi:ubiquinone/menaquinone biosynthesis C-methylase UbiE
MKIAQKFHEAQRLHRSDGLADDEKKVASWLDESTIDAWRHNRMLSFLDPLLKSCPGNQWLTIGDGRYAFETRYLIKKDRQCDVTTTDLSDSLLSEALQKGLIQKFKIENCESLSFADDSFDFVLCKESYHHLPCPYAALYEMIRVARKAVILIEPNDLVLGSNYYKKFVQAQNGYVPMKDILRALLRKAGILQAMRKLRGFAQETKTPDVQAEFEPSGNFVYGISEREIEKVALGLGLPAVAFASFNDYYEEGVEFEPANSDSMLFRKVQSKIAEANATSSTNILCAVLFRMQPEDALNTEMQKKGFVLKKIPSNPYLP